MDLTNCQGVGSAGDRVVVMIPRCQMTRTEALVHAAWLVTVADRGDAFPSILELVKQGGQSYSAEYGR